MNVLLTCAGRRTYSVEAFKQAVGDQGCVFACDSNADAPALQKADGAYIVPHVGHEGYVDALSSICNNYHTELLVPALQPELFARLYSDHG